MKLPFVFIGVLTLCINTSARLEFTNVKCEAVDKTYNSVKFCFLKSVNRTYKYYSVANHFHSSEPINNVSVGMQLKKKANGYKPFLYNFTVDGCKFLRTSGNKLTRYFYKAFSKYSNITHPCPYQHDLAVEKLPTTHIENLFTKVLPMPTGDYSIKSYWYSYKTLRATVELFITLS